MVELGVLKLAVKSLGSSQDKEKETAVLLLHELSLHPHTCKQMGSEKGAILFLVGLTTNTDEDLQIARVAEKTLKNLEQMDVTVLQMAEAGRLQPLLSRLCEGTNKQEILQMSLPCVFSLSLCLSIISIMLSTCCLIQCTCDGQCRLRGNPIEDGATSCTDDAHKQQQGDGGTIWE